MHTLIFISGAQGSGKTTLANLIRNSEEVQLEEKKVQDVEAEILEKVSFNEVIVVTTQKTNSVIQPEYWEQYAFRNKVKFLKYRL